MQIDFKTEPKCRAFIRTRKMGRKAVKVAILLLGAVFCCSRERLYESSISIQLAEAFLFQQLPPSYQELNSTSSNYLNNYSQLRNQQSKQNRAQVATNQAQSYYTRDSSNTNSEDTYDVFSCPRECHCDRVAQIADCSNRKLLRVPNGFPKDIKRIRLERNNITELGPYAFEGLKRLQRIDLSNNNLLKIDPLAFSGGLQSLNSLILYSNKLNQLPVNIFSELSQLQLLLLNANSIQCISKELLQPLTNLNLLSLYDNNIETLPNGTFDGLKNIKTM